MTRKARTAHFKKIARESRGLPSRASLKELAEHGGALAQAYVEWHGKKHHTWNAENPTSCDETRETD